VTISDERQTATRELDIDHSLDKTD